MTHADQDAKPKGTEFLFLASHGLLSPISAIRWGCNRLKRTDTKGLSKEQHDILNHIYANARVLSKLFSSMLMLARNEDQTYPLHPERFILKNMLQAEARTWQDHEGGTLHLTCDPSLMVEADKGLLEAILQNLFTVFAESSQPPRHLTITAEDNGDGFLEIVYSGTMQLSFLQSVRTIENLDESRPIVGGTPGLLLSLSHALGGFLGAALEMHERGEETYDILLRIPTSAA